MWLKVRLLEYSYLVLEVTKEEKTNNITVVFSITLKRNFASLYVYKMYKLNRC